MTFGIYLSVCLFGIFACFFGGTVEALVGAQPVNNSYEFPYQVSVQDHLHRHICGGGVITRRFVLTAANCLVNPDSEFIIERLYIVVGTINIFQSGSSALTVQVQKSFVPREFDPRSHRYDIALLKLTHHLIHPTRPRELLWLDWPWVRYLEHTSTGIIAGFGLTRFDANYRQTNASSVTYSRLKFATSRILSHMECQQAYPHLAISSEYNFCARMETANTLFPFGVCAGDPGGVLVQGRDAKAVVIGVLVKTSPNCDEKEGRGRPALYTRVSRYEMFMLLVIAGSNENIREITYQH